MLLKHIPSDLPHLPAPSGAHSLAWSYLLDAACADALHAGAAELTLTLPSSLADEISARQPFAAAPPFPAGRPGRGATFGLQAASDPNVVRHYRLRFGPLARPQLRTAAAQRSGAAVGLVRTQSLYVYTLRARLLGIPMRLFNLIGRPQPADRALIALRYAFASERATPSFYILETWRRIEGQR